MKKIWILLFLVVAAAFSEIYLRIKVWGSISFAEAIFIGFGIPFLGSFFCFLIWRISRAVSRVAKLDWNFSKLEQKAFLSIFFSFLAGFAVLASIFLPDLIIAAKLAYIFSSLTGATFGAIVFFGVIAILFLDRDRKLHELFR